MNEEKQLGVAKKEDMVNHPSHYVWLKKLCGVEPIEICQYLNFCIGNAIKYVLRAGVKTECGMPLWKKQIQDYEKAIWYINREIELIKKEHEEDQ